MSDSASTLTIKAGIHPKIQLLQAFEAAKGHLVADQFTNAI